MTQDTSNSVLVRTVTKLDLDACYHVETSSFPPSEAATRDRIALRIEQYPQGFLVAVVDGRVVGHINSGATDKEDITDEELKALVGHDPAGANIIVFSLAVLPDYRNRGIASHLMRRFIEESRLMGKQRILLLCKANMIGFYERLGFDYAGVSDSTYGGASWHAMEYALGG
jgi:ribosomal protein S18 acetylase RimI-like enzyme